MSNDLKARARARFGAAADKYATSDIHARGDSLDVLLELARPRSDWVMLDVATGAGHTASMFSPHVALVIAVDLAEAMLTRTAALAATKCLGNIRTVACDAEYSPFADNCFNVVTCRLAFHHFPSPDRAIKEFRRVLKPDGILALTDNVTVDEPEAAAFYNAYEKLRDPSHHCVYSLLQLKSMLTKAGFAIDATRQLTKELEFHTWADRQNVSSADKDTLIKMMRNLPEALRPLFVPRWANGTMCFSLWEAVVLAR